MYGGIIHGVLVLPFAVSVFRGLVFTKRQHYRYCLSCPVKCTDHFYLLSMTRNLYIYTLTLFHLSSPFVGTKFVPNNHHCRGHGIESCWSHLHFSGVSKKNNCLNCPVKCKNHFHYTYRNMRILFHKAHLYKSIRFILNRVKCNLT